MAGIDQVRKYPNNFPRHNVNTCLGQKKKKTVSHPRDFENPSGSQGFFFFLNFFLRCSCMGVDIS